jgi:hypothetical protein
MKLIFKKDEKSLISVFQNVDGQEKDFSYVDMIKTLIVSKKLEEPEVLDNFSEAEINSINRMVTCINEAVSTTQE